MDAHGPRLHLVPAVSDEPPITAPPTPEERRDEGIQRASEHADRVRREWTASTVVYATALVQRRGYKPFLAEEIKEIAERDGVPKPPDGRAWGQVMRNLRRAGIIRHLGYAPAKSSNLSPKCLWGRAVSEKDEHHPHD